MKARILVPGFLCLIVFLTSCSPTRKSAVGTEGNKQVPQSSVPTGKAGAPVTGTYWKLVEVMGKPISTQVDKEPYIQLDEADKRLSGTGGCNSFSGGYELMAQGRIRFTQMAMTQMACLNMETEDALLKALGAVDHYNINNDTLVLNKARMAPMARFVAVTKETKTSDLNGSWELNYISGPRIAFAGLYPQEKPTITFSLPDTKVIGNSGCNRFFGNITVAENHITFGEPATTRMACEGEGEQVFLRTLQRIDKFSISSDHKTLNLIMGDVAMMRFEKK